MAVKKNPLTKIKGCEQCTYRASDFFKDEEDKEVIRCYCSARFANVNAELMTKFCDFFSLRQDDKTPEKKSKGI